MGKCALCLAVLLPQPIKHLIRAGLRERATRDAAVGEVLRVGLRQKRLLGEGAGSLQTSGAVWVDPVRVN